MPKYEVILKEIEIYVVEIEAETEEEALDKAWDTVMTKEGKLNYYHESDGDSEVHELWKFY